MAHHDDIPFAFIFNNDMYTPPGKPIMSVGALPVALHPFIPVRLTFRISNSFIGALRNLSREMWNIYEQDPILCIAHMHGWSAFAMTKRALRVLGFFDENIFPAYWEDNDIQIRLNRAMRAGHCSPIQKLASASLQHNYYDHYVR